MLFRKSRWLLFHFVALLLLFASTQVCLAQDSVDSRCPEIRPLDSNYGYAAGRVRISDGFSAKIWPLRSDRHFSSSGRRDTFILVLDSSGVFWNSHQVEIDRFDSGRICRRQPVDLCRGLSGQIENVPVFSAGSAFHPDVYVK